MPSGMAKNIRNPIKLGKRNKYPSIASRLRILDILDILKPFPLKRPIPAKQEWVHKRYFYLVNRGSAASQMDVAASSAVIDPAKS